MICAEALENRGFVGPVSALDKGLSPMFNYPSVVGGFFLWPRFSMREKRLVRRFFGDHPIFPRSSWATLM